MDPVEGGVENNYVYPPDAVNDFDLDGNFSWKAVGIGAGVVAGTAAACYFTAGLGCGAAVVRMVAVAGPLSVKAASWASKSIGSAARLKKAVGQTKYTEHAIKQMAGRDGGRGVTKNAVEYTLKYGKSLGPKVDQLRRWSWVYESSRARVAVNSKGQVITALAKSSKYWRNK